ncbi:MAG: homoserine O-acetyltransferase [Candidatus Firestonebacteria bacterium]
MNDKDIKKIEESPLGVSEVKYFSFDSLILDSGETLSSVTIAYETYGNLSKERDNVILVCHALSGDAHVAGISTETEKTGWWEFMVGPNKPFDTNKYFIICVNVIGGCKGSTGPCSINPKTGKVYGVNFPSITIKDMIEAQVKLIDYLKIEKIFCVAGGSMGGMQVLQWVYSYPNKVVTALPMATTFRHTPQQIAFNEVGRRAITGDPAWYDGDYYEKGFPTNGLSIARMLGHITYMSDISMKEKFGRKLKSNENYDFDLDTGFEVGEYLKYRGESFVQRFDANSYLYITRAIDYFNLGDNKDIIKRFSGIKTKFLVVSYSHDWLYPTYQSKEIVKVLKYSLVNVTYCEISSTYGHDAFLIKNEEQESLVRHFLNNAYQGLKNGK